MIVEILQLYELIFGKHEVGWLSLFFISLIAYVSILKLKSRNYTAQLRNVSPNLTWAVSAIIPFYDENPDLLIHNIDSIRSQGVKEIIAITDNPNESYDTLCRVQAKVDQLIVLPSRMGKRYCEAKAFETTTGDYILLVDSDTTMMSGCLISMLEAFDIDGDTDVFFNQPVGGVSTHHRIYLDQLNTVQGAYSVIIEACRSVVDKALSKAGKLVVLDGRCSLYRRAAIGNYITSDAFLKEHDNGNIFVTGDDRQLTRHVNSSGWKTRVSDGLTYTASQPTLRTFLNQQLRWMRSGYRYFLMDVTDGQLGNSLMYAYQELFYFLAPWIFVAVIVHDVLFLSPPAGITIPLLYVIPVVIIGSSLVSGLRQVIMTNRMSLKYFFHIGFLGVVILFPLSLWAFITRKSQHLWLTR